MSVEELVKVLESAGFHVHVGMKGKITWKGALVDRLQDLSTVVHKYYNDTATSEHDTSSREQ